MSGEPVLKMSRGDQIVRLRMEVLRSIACASYPPTTDQVAYSIGMAGRTCRRIVGELSDAGQIQECRAPLDRGKRRWDLTRGRAA